MFDKDFNLVSANSAGKRLLGLPPKGTDSGVGQNLLDLMPSIQETATYDKLLLVLESGKSYAEDAVILPTKAGNLCLNLRALKIQEHIGIVASDLTGHASIIDSLRESENKFREALIENALDPVIIINRNGTIGYKSSAIEHVLGYRPEDDIGRSSFDFVHPDDLPGAANAFARLIQTSGSTMQYELRARHADSSWHMLQIMGQNLLDNPAVGGVVASFRDVTDERIAQEELSDSEERFRNVLNNSIDMVYRLSFITSQYDYVSPSSEQLLGYSPEEFKALGIEHAAFQIHPDDLDKLSANIIDLIGRSKQENAASTVEYRVKHDKLGYRWVSDNRSVVFGDEGT
ncbi:MAG: PAS domain-containing protein, partial [Dehalococcoidia bacterium]|nr:PAS domain-containing protein [Dehalococcoidia bacterium]